MAIQIPANPINLGNFDFTVRSSQSGLSYAFATTIVSNYVGVIEVSPLNAQPATTTTIQPEWDYSFKLYSGNAVQDARDWVWVLNTTSVQPGSKPQLEMGDSAGTFDEFWPDGDDQNVPNPQFQRPWAPEGENVSLVGGPNNTFYLTVKNSGGPLLSTFALVAAPDPYYYKANYSGNTTEAAATALGVLAPGTRNITDYFETVYNRTLLTPAGGLASVSIDTSTTNALVAVQSHFYKFTVASDGWVTIGNSGVSNGNLLLYGGSLTGFLVVQSGQPVHVGPGDYKIEALDSLTSVSAGQSVVAIRTPGETFQAYSLTVSFAGPTDLTVPNVSLSSTSVLAGGTTTVSYTIADSGITSGPGTISVYLSTDPTITTSDIHLVDISSLVAVPTNGSLNQSAQITVPSNLAPGQYYIGVIVNRDGAVTETNLNNNASVGRPITITNVVSGGPGNDNLIGGPGNEVIVGGPDIITPALGNLPGQTGQMGPEWHVVSTQDFTGDGKADIMWVRNTTGDATLWTMNNGTLAGFSATQGHMGPEWTAAGSGDFNRDGTADLVWTHSGDVALWLMNGPNLAGVAVPGGHMGPEWKLQGMGDFNNDGFSDLVWHSSNADVAIWSMSGTSLGGYGVSNGHIGKEWNARAVADFNGDGRDEILWVSDTGDIQTWSMFGSNVTGTTNTGHMGPSWSVAGTGDFNMDGKMDLVWVDSLTNNVQIWRMNGGSIAQIITPAGHMGPEWKLQGVGDFNGDARPDLLWVTASGKTAVWNMTGTGDVMAGGGGSDTFQFNALSETGKVITDFAPGAGGDILDLHTLELATGYTGNDGLRDGSVRLIQNGVNTEVQVDSHFGEHHFVDAVTLQNVNAAALVHANFLV